MSTLSLMRLGVRNLLINKISLLYRRNYLTSSLLKSQNTSNDHSHIDTNEPYCFSKSPAANWKAKESRQPVENKPACQSLVISVSLFVFMCYFFIFREENDIDQIFHKDLKHHFAEMSDEEFITKMNLNPAKRTT